MLPGLLTRRERVGRALSGGVRTDRLFAALSARASAPRQAQIALFWRLRAHRRPVRSGSELEPGGPFPFRRAHPDADHDHPASPTRRAHPDWRL